MSANNTDTQTEYDPWWLEAAALLFLVLLGPANLRGAVDRTGHVYWREVAAAFAGSILWLSAIMVVVSHV